MSMDIKGYETLASVLQAAYDQAAVGKGAERHATGLPFDQQPMQTGSDLLGTDAGLAFQAIKKIREGSAFAEYERFERELLGAIVYIAGMIIWRKRQQPAHCCPYCHSAEGSLHHPDCHRMRRGKSVLAQAVDAFEAVSLHAAVGAALEEPAAQIDDESDRQKAVEQNGPDGAIYDNPWYGAPEWARFKAQDEDGQWWWFSARPVQTKDAWVCGDDVDVIDTFQFDHHAEPNPNWRDTLIERTSG